MNKKGFTLIEILAAVIIVGLISGMAVFVGGKIIKNAREKEAKRQEEILTSLGLTIYAHEKLSVGNSVFVQKYKAKEKFYIDVQDLVSAGYIDGGIKNPNGDGKCTGYLIYDSSVFSSCLSCPNVNDKTCTPSGSKLEWKPVGSIYKWQ